MDHVLFNNLIISFGEKQYLLLNLTSFRRKRITLENYNILKDAWQKTLSGELLGHAENDLLQKLTDEKQILSKDVDAHYFSALKRKNLEICVPFPVRSLTFNITHQCNFSCDYCYQQLYNRLPKYTGRMSCDDIDEIAIFLQSPIFLQSEMEDITISGGEPLLPGNEAVINHIVDRFPAQEVTLFTNGVNIDRFKSKVNFNKFTKFQISLDGPNETIFELNHSSETVQTILHGIDYILSIGKTVSLAVMWTNSLEQNIESFVSLIEKTGFCSNANFSVGIVSIKDYSKGEIIDKRFYNWKYLLECEKKYAQVLSRIGATFSVCSEINLLRRALYRPFNERFAPKTNCCRAEKSIPVIFEPNGEVHWCVCLGKEHGIIGNYKSKIVLEDRIKALANRSIFTIQQCNECSYKYLCGGGCVLNNIGNDTSVEAPFCNIFKEHFFWNNLKEFI